MWSLSRWCLCALLINLVNNHAVLETAAVNTNSTFLKATVIEFKPIVWAGQGKATCAEVQAIVGPNVANLTRLIKTAAENGSELVVLPEYGLQGPDLGDYDDALPWLYDLSSQTPVGICGDAVTKLAKVAATSGVDIVLNVGEVLWSNHSDALVGSRHQYNAQVVLSGKDGALVTVYRKSHLYYEPAFDANPHPSPVSFQTWKSGVRVGLLICFDMMHAEPTLRLVQQVPVIAFSTWWPNYPPLLTGTQQQSGFVRRFENITLLAAGSGAMGWPLSGSGIYNCNEKSVSLLQFSAASSESKMVSLNISVSSSQSNAFAWNTTSQIEHQDDFLPNRSPRPSRTSSSLDINVTMLNFEDLLKRRAVVVEASTGIVSCVLRADMHSYHGELSADQYRYALIAASGLYNDLFEAVFCALIPCEQEDAECFEDPIHSPFAPPLQGINVNVSLKLLSESKELMDYTLFPQGTSSSLAALLDDSILASPDRRTIMLNPSEPQVTTLAIVGVALQ